MIFISTSIVSADLIVVFTVWRTFLFVSAETMPRFDMTDKDGIIFDPIAPRAGERLTAKCTLVGLTPNDKRHVSEQSSSDRSNQQILFRSNGFWNDSTMEKISHWLLIRMFYNSINLCHVYKQFMSLIPRIGIWYLIRWIAMISAIWLVSRVSMMESNTRVFPV